MARLGASVETVAAMVIEEILVDGFAAAEAFFEAVPEVDAFLAEAPAEQNFGAAVHGGEIDEADAEVLDLAAVGVDLLDGFVQLGRGSVTAVAHFRDFVALHHRSAKHGDPAQGIL